MSSTKGALADWLRAMDALQPADAETANAIARHLGLRVEAAATPPVHKRQHVNRDMSMHIDIARYDESNRPQPGKSRRRLESVLVPANASRNPAPSWLTAARHLETADTPRTPAAVPLDPLFANRTSRGILSGALATPAATGPLDVEVVIERLARAEHITEIPRESVPTMSRGVQLLIDRWEGMQPFAADQAVLRSALVSVAGRDRTQVLYFEGLPLWGTGTGPRDEWPDYQAPAPGTPVVLLTDLGIGQPPEAAGMAGIADWREFAVMLARKQCPLLALVPYAPSRWPAGITKYMTVIQWDRSTTASAVRRAIPRGLRVVREL